jgi:hypothetical protein
MVRINELWAALCYGHYTSPYLDWALHYTVRPINTPDRDPSISTPGKFNSSHGTHNRSGRTQLCLDFSNTSTRHQHNLCLM